MYTITLKESVVFSNSFLDVNDIFPHEEVIIDRMEKLVNYLASLKPYIIIPSILVCSETNMIIDGHHRYYALRKLGFEKVPVTKINYSSKLITTHLDNQISKELLIKAALSQKVLPPKSSFHHIIDIDYKLQPIILLSALSRIDYL